MLLRYDSSQVAVEDVQEGDLLLGPDGGPRRAFNVVNGKDRLYRIEAGNEPLVVTPNHILVLHRKGQGQNRYQGLSVEDHHQNFADRFGDLPDLSSDPCDPDRPVHLTKQRPDFMSALKSAIAWMLAVPRSGRNAAQIRNYLNGTTGVFMQNTTYRVMVFGKEGEYESFSWGNPARESLHGHANHPPVFLETKEKAFAAAVARAREMRSRDGDSLDNLRARYLREIPNGPRGKIKLDPSLPGMYLHWLKDGTNPSIAVNFTSNKIYYNRWFRFSEMPDSDVEEDDTPNKSLVGNEFPEVEPIDHYDTVTMTASEFAALTPAQQRRHTLFKCGPFEYPSQGVPLDPYFLGLWLGDGLRHYTTIANNHEAEIVDFLASYAAELDLQLSYHGGLSYSIVGTKRSTVPFPAPRQQRSTNTQQDDQLTLQKRGTIIERRIAAGWTVQPGRLPGQARRWQPPTSDINQGSAPSNSFGPTGTQRPATSSVIDLTLSSDENEPPESSQPVRLPYRALSQPLREITNPPEGALNTPQQLRAPKHFLSSSPTKPEARRQRVSPMLDHGLPSSLPPSPTRESSPPIPSEIAESICEDPLDQLRSDADFMTLAGPPRLPDEPLDDDTTESDLETNESLVLNMLDTITEDVTEDTDMASTSESDLDGDDLNAAAKRVTRLKTGNRAYGALDDDELDMLVDRATMTGSAEAASGQSARAKPRVNKLLMALDQLKLRSRGSGKGPSGDTKHIPEMYIKNSRAIRLAVLAGLIDSDGCYISHADTTRCGNRYLQFAQAEAWHATLFWDTVRLAKSLGFIVSTFIVPARPRKWSESLQQFIKTGRMLRLRISGNIHEVPCLLARKQPPMTRLHEVASNINIRGITLEDEPTKWAGFRVDKDQLYLRHDHMVLHNSGKPSTSHSLVMSRN